MGELDIAGTWDSRYEFPEGSENRHSVVFNPEESASGRFIGRSEPDETGSVLTLNLSVKDNSAWGIWSEYTSSQGPHKGLVFEGLVELIINQEVTLMSGRWLGLDSKKANINIGSWRFMRL